MAKSIQNSQGWINTRTFRDAWEARLEQRREEARNLEPFAHQVYGLFSRVVFAGENFSLEQLIAALRNNQGQNNTLQELRNFLRENNRFEEARDYQRILTQVLKRYFHDYWRGMQVNLYSYINFIKDARSKGLTNNDLSNFFRHNTHQFEGVIIQHELLSHYWKDKDATTEIVEKKLSGFINHASIYGIGGDKVRDYARLHFPREMAELSRRTSNSSSNSIEVMKFTRIA